MNRTPWWASWIAPATTRSYGWVPSCGCPPYGSCRTSPSSSVSLAPVARTNGRRVIGTSTFRGLSFSTSRRFSSAFWSRTRIMSPARSYTTTSSFPNCCRVVVTRSRPPSCANVTSKMPPRRSPKGIGPAVDTLVAESFRDVDRRLLGVDQVAFRAREAALVRQDVVPLFDLDEGALRILRIVDDADLLGHRREME